MAEAAEPFSTSTFSISFGFRSAMRLSGFSWVMAEMADPAARVTLFVPEPIATSLTMTPSTTYSGCAEPRIDEMPRMRMRLPPPGAPVDCEICAPAILPWKAFSIDCVETFVTSSALTLATEVARLRREIPVAWPVITIWSSLSASRLSTISTLLAVGATRTSVCG